MVRYQPGLLAVGIVALVVVTIFLLIGSVNP